MAGTTPERQEKGLIDAINAAVRKNSGNPITLVTSRNKIIGVIGAEKYNGRQTSGSEPYTDVVIKTTKGIKNISCKGPSAPSLAGGGLKGLELAVPGIASKFMRAAYAALIKKLNPGDKVPDVFGKITGATKDKIVIGNAAMGGPIDFMYIGPMDVAKTYDEKNNKLNISGEFYEAKAYSQSHELYFRLRARREDQRFDPDAKDTNGTPKIYGKSPSKGDSAGRIVVIDKVSSNGIVVNI